MVADVLRREATAAAPQFRRQTQSWSGLPPRAARFNFEPEIKQGNPLDLSI